MPFISQDQVRLIDLAREKGASIWLSTLLLSAEGYNISKNLFWDLIRIRYGWSMKRLLERCECGDRFTLQHALSCKKGFVSLRHNHLRNITCNLLSEVCNDVAVEPVLHDLSGEDFASPSSSVSDEARVDVKARDFWQANQKPLVFSEIGGVGREAAKMYSRLPEMIAEKRNVSYAKTISWIRREISFSLIKSIGIYVRGSRSSFGQVITTFTDPSVSEVLSSIAD